MKSVAQILKGKQIQSIHTIAPEDTVLDALRQMAEKNVGALPVTDVDGRLVGIVSERDYARKVVLQGRSSIGTPVSAIMTSAVITVDPRQDIKECMQLMTERHLRHLPVIEEGRLIGLLSIGDLVKEINAEQESLIQHLEGYIRGE
ncbi:MULTISPECIES: CBS domain-containing protein [Pseudomonas]|uniref:CBS domain-containing protein n=1 Tax=Pseudomonas kuykendallii TaxID=1007099 RepID=A0A2W5CXQ7_9PSED|nr:MULTISPECIES: CBS domain-containing protein [Pseudomonas]MCQ4272478.1 CBS domain-containing protein [Pseudomonas kuykendallii]PZP20980.1 MAG: CBS domain-containing protein [Pseudomonas kuykendallii]SDW34860.1 CBS domain-containing protein [Pseudomonas kuykendallii]